MKKNIFKQSTLIGLIFLGALLLSRQSQAYLAVNETAELLPDGIFKLGIAPQLKLSDGGGFDVAAYFDTYITDDLNGRVSMGLGNAAAIDFWTSASVKWVPFPDVGRQPAMGLRGALIYARDERVDISSFQIAPLISKLADTSYGKMIPYVALPITVSSTNSTSTTSTQFAVGAEWFSNKDMHVGAELDLNLNKSFTAFSAFISFPFDQSVGFKK
jgi:hypothetical protein